MLGSGEPYIEPMNNMVPGPSAIPAPSADQPLASVPMQYPPWPDALQPVND